MRIKLLIATSDADYGEHLSENISEHHADVIDVSVCWTQERLHEILPVQRFDVALLEASLIRQADMQSVKLPLIMSDGDDDVAVEFAKIHKYQRISSIVAGVLEHYSKVSANSRDNSKKASITAVWSPAGGVGKSTVALAYAARKQADGKKALYLDLESFSSIPAYFTETGKSISSVFEMLESNEGNVKMLVRSILKRDTASGIAYFCRPDNFDDINILSVENIGGLIADCSEVTDELIIDMSSVCDERTREIFELADKVLLVTDQTITVQAKLDQFMSQHNVFKRIKDKTVLITNRTAAIGTQDADSGIRLPLVQSSDPSAVYKALSGCNFEMRVIQHDSSYPQ